MYKEILGFNGKYIASSEGNILNDKGRILKTWANRGHRQVELYKDTIGKKYYVHRVIAETFIDNPKNCLLVNHRNGNKSDNRVKNLEWCNHKENMEHYVNMYDQRYIKKLHILKLYTRNKEMALSDFVDILMNFKR